MTEADRRHEPSAKKASARFSWKACACAAVFGYLVSRALMGGAWYPPVVFLAVLFVVVLVVPAVRQSRQGAMVGISAVRRDAVRLKPLTRRLQQAMELSEVGDLAAAGELIDSVAAHPDLVRHPLLVANVALMRSDIAMAQGDLPTAEQEAIVAVRHHEQGAHRSTTSETLEKLGKIQFMMGRKEDAHRTLTQALEVGGGYMYRLSRVRTELYLSNIAFDADDIPAAIEHSMAARKLAAKWRCQPQHASACDLLALMALAENRIDDAARWTAEAARVLTHDDCTLPNRVRHLITTALVAHAHGNEREALEAYLAMMRGVAELRAGWGWRDAQTFYVDLYSEHEFAAYATAHTLYLSGDPSAVNAFALLLDLGNRTALRRMLRGELLLQTPDDMEQQGMGEIVEVLTTLASAEGTMTPGAARAAEMQASSPRTGPQQVTQAYERLETLVSLRFRWALSAKDEGHEGDPRTYARRWDSHVLQVRLVGNDSMSCIAGLWTDPDGTQHPFLHPVQGAAGVLLGEVTGIEALRQGPASPSPAQAPPDVADGETQGVRAEAPDWRTTARCRHLTARDTAPWATLARLLLPAGLLDLLRCANPAGTVPKLLVVPDSLLWRVPWTALSVEPNDPEGYVLDRAVLAMLPSLSLADSAPPGAAEAPHSYGPVEDRAFTYLAGVDAEGLDLERSALDAAYGTGVVHARTPSELLAVLGPGGAGFSLGAASVHGNDSPGLAHALRLDRRTQLSAARMLTLRFPRTLLINACLSAELDERRGTDPLGIPTVALCRGSETVIGGIFPLPDGKAKNPRYNHPTARILANLYRLLAEGLPPSTALRAAQRQYRAEVGPVPPRLWAGLVSITTTFNDPRQP